MCHVAITCAPRVIAFAIYEKQTPATVVRTSSTWMAKRREVDITVSDNDFLRDECNVKCEGKRRGEIFTENVKSTRIIRQ